MNPSTQATLVQLQSAHWFDRVGVQDTETAIVLATWEEAVDSANSTEWEGLCLEAANQYRERLLEKSVDRYRAWNGLVEQLKPISEAIVKEKTDRVVIANALPKSFVDTVKWDILHVLMEAEYSDVYPPGFYASQGYWYVKGHFPCGYRGQFPRGRRVVF